MTIQERKNNLVTDHSKQETIIKQIEERLKAEQVKLHHIEGAILLCDELLAEPKPVQSVDIIAES